MTINPFRISMLIITMAGVGTILAAACGGSAPEAVEIPVTVEGKTMNPGTIRVKQGDMVTLKIQADEGGEFHLHTYDIEADIPATSETDFFFVANATGRFKITYHSQEEGEHDEEEGEHDDEDEEGEIEVGFLEVQPR